ncbi:MAG: diaminopimelate epimerase, partial [Gammaproteobacteria bacterium]|nr:diaminopimelate epimerase [Gammaproteobacteria bacterium]
SVQVNLPGGTLIVSWAGQGPVRMSGPTETVFEGIWRVD